MNQVDLLPDDDQVHERAANVAFGPRVGDANAVVPFEAMRFIKGKSAVRFAVHPKRPVGKPPKCRRRLRPAVLGVPGGAGQILDAIVVEAGAAGSKVAVGLLKRQDGIDDAFGAGQRTAWQIVGAVANAA